MDMYGDDELYIVDQHLNSGQMFFILLGMLPIITCFPCWIVANFIYKPMKNKGKAQMEELIKNEKQFPPYEYQYPIPPCKENSSKETNINNIVIDNTPDGYVAIRYDEEEEGFLYWSDKNISYKYLEAIARKYVKMFNCRGIYIDRGYNLREKILKIRKEIIKNIETEKNREAIEGDEEGESEEEDVFASLKKYNTSSKKTDKLKKRITRNDIVCEKSNKYIKRGKFKNNKEWMKSFASKKKTNNSSSGLLSWLSWKKQQTNTD